MPSLVLDSEGRPVPQHLMEDGSAYEPSLGADGALNVNLSEYAPLATPVIASAPKGLPVILVLPSGAVAGGSTVNGIEVDVTQVQGDVSAQKKLYNGAAWEEAYNNHEIVALASAARTASTPSADLVNQNAKGAAILLDITAVSSGSITGLEVQAKVGSAYVTIASVTGLTLSAIGQYVVLVFPETLDTAATISLIKTIIPRNWRLKVNHADTNSITYAVTVSYVV